MLQQLIYELLLLRRSGSGVTRSHGRYQMILELLGVGGIPEVAKLRMVQSGSGFGRACHRELLNLGRVLLDVLPTTDERGLPFSGTIG
ncbi:MULTISPECIES: hypothetical protein [Micromonospora]|uniref:hypothetical protein n=1 Tax=Micromonospora TaxID=1873 RepID=UPI000B890FFC|nr:hypothetical protein [Micromonospora yangpuensis]